MNIVSEYLTVKEVATHFRLSNKQVYRLIHDGHINAVRIGGAVRIPRRELDRLDPNRSSSESDPTVDSPAQQELIGL
ncbi:helix-turn-helix domain-containing protein [Aurantimicrobium minutum]|uniref:helix-turn-helix domain-containing protein n=1 Tax=Aurantimicrobium minutum TaxID=708131 RepID=UPI002475CDB2|nr:helix-turn-helix domain-containing protein [Aurantimicrobium minutum]